MQKWGKRPIYFKNAEIMQNALIMQTLRPLNKEILKKKYFFIVFIWGGGELTSVKSNPHWDLAYAAIVAALLLLFLEPGRFSILQYWFGFSGLSVALRCALADALPLVLLEEASEEDRACANDCTSALGDLS